MSAFFILQDVLDVFREVEEHVVSTEDSTRAEKDAVENKLVCIDAQRVKAGLTEYMLKKNEAAVEIRPMLQEGMTKSETILHRFASVERNIECVKEFAHVMSLVNPSWCNDRVVVSRA